MFLTNFDIREIERYRQAVETWDSPYKTKLRVSNQSRDKQTGAMGSLHWFGSFEQLQGFWDHFDSIAKENHEQA